MDLRTVDSAFDYVCARNIYRKKNSHFHLCLEDLIIILWSVYSLQRISIIDFANETPNLFSIVLFYEYYCGIFS